MRGYFVTATGTDIGKTYISARLIEVWRSRGFVTQATKPLMSGFAEDALEQSDAGRLLLAMGQVVTPASVSEICLHRLAPPLAPNVAMRQAGIVQNYNEIRSFVERRLAVGADVHLVEGAGGVMSPLTDETLQIDLMADLQLKVILVTAPYLGSISHTLTAIDALQARGLEIAALVVSQPFVSGGQPGAFIEEVCRFRTLPMVGIPHGQDAKSLDLLLMQQDAGI
ncbi:dethiobiotin synthase [Hyphomonas polymorpha PS728]|uniref:ATP-dependent dethiobiotin synthetase BioD n=1 Tax=Hyphomonas polymorpha PS728 TaxID=1280954 RepID=A0A062VL51_9PROT|nr:MULTISPECIES: dethiobiotin synthase [Hyphomonas]AXE64520.1 dethiobiotin synthase [Hyphomonas sp. CACIAM 19H1]KCZ98834.1 dethiobiotin synthase [Hyphomonas polymorpha PS728]